MTRLLHGDCIEQLRHVADNSVELVFSDLPYGVTANKWDTCIPLAPLWAELLRVGKPRCAYVFTATQPFATTLINSQPKMFRYDIVWDKGVSANFVQASYRVIRSHEGILVFSRASATYGARMNMTYNPQMTIKDKAQRPQFQRVKSLSAPLQKQHEDYLKNKVYTHSHPRSLLPISIRADKDRGLHPTQKPVALLEWLVRTYSNPGDTVLDPTMGSGTTGVACRNTGREFIGIERDASYFEVAKARINNNAPTAMPVKRRERTTAQRALFAAVP